MILCRPFRLSVLVSTVAILLSLPCSESVKVIKINAGGLALGDFAEDPASYIQGNSNFYRSAFKEGLTVGLSHRWGHQGGFAYDIPTGNGVFDVDLIFAEIYEPAMKDGARIFDVSVEDGIKLPNFDVYAQAGEGNKEVTKSLKGIKVNDLALTVSFIPGPSENPMVSALIIKKSDGSDFPYSPGVSGEGVGTANVDSKDYDHQAHAVAGGPYTETDYNNDGEVVIEMDGTNSHSHYNNPDTGESGKVVSYSWKVNGNQISDKAKFSALFPVGTTIMELTVKDQTGDTATAETQVIVLPSTAGGVYCYYYLEETDLPGSFNPKSGDGPKPDAGHSSDTINYDDDDFPYEKKDSKTWAARCLTDFTSSSTKQYELGIQYKGAKAQLYVNGVLKVEGGDSGGGVKSISVMVTAATGKTPIQIIYYRNGLSGSLKFFVDGAVAPPSTLGFQSSTIMPTITSTSVATANPGGGGQLQIKGTGFFNQPKVKIGSFSPTFTTVSATEIVLGSIPSQAESGGKSVPVTVSNNGGVSNAETLEYSDADKATNGVAWEQTFLKTDSGSKYPLKQVTSIAIGPDSFYYAGSLSGFVTKFTAGKDLKVKSPCTGPPSGLGDSRAILGVAFNYKSSTNRLYVTTSSLYFALGGPFKNDVQGWANGAVESLTSGCGCLCYEKKVVTGLPVSNHDHGVNALLFLPNGDMLISIGGSTNAGHNTPGNKLGGWPESPLSGSIVVAKLSKPGFNGAVTYNQYTDPATTKQNSGDVEVYAPGFRNCFGMALRTNGEVWATDNGPNFGYGDVSVDCGTNAPYAEKQYDELNLVVKGVYYGHANRNRGGGQCKYTPGVVNGSPGQPKALFVSSSTAVTEYTANVFGADLKQKLIVGKYAASGSGLLWRIEELDNGNINPIQMADYSALSMTVGLHGELVMPRVQQGFVAVMKPVYKVPAGPLVMNVSPRRGLAGGKVFVSGENFAPTLTAKFGANQAQDIQFINSNGFFCSVPPGSGTVSMVVTVNGQSNTVVGGADFIYA